MEERTLQLQPNEVQGPGGTITEKPPSSPPALLFSDDESDDDGESAEFEFPSVSRDSPAGTAAPADELFADGRIRPFYYPAAPVFGRGAVSLGAGSTGFVAGQHQPAAAPAAPQRVRGQLGRLFLEESRARDSYSSVSSESDDDGGGLEGAPPESYCLWTPAGSSSSSPRPAPPSRKRSSSTGSSVARWRRISELVVGRSHSDGKDRFMFFFPAHAQPKGEPAAGDDKRRHDKIKMPPTSNSKQGNKRPSSTASGDGRKLAPSPSAEVDSAHRVGIAYGATPRRTFLPYREELVGFFANVNGNSRSHHLTF